MIKIICFGKIKEQYFVDAIKEYQKRISKYAILNIIELPDYNTDDKKITLKKEKESLLKIFNNKEYNILLDIEGNMQSSLELGNKIDKIYNINSNITFIIGGSYGVDEEIKEMVKYKLSFSKMTFPHQLFRVLLLEQLYRAFKINNNEEYHK